MGKAMKVNRGGGGPITGSISGTAYDTASLLLSNAIGCSNIMVQIDKAEGNDADHSISSFSCINGVSSERAHNNTKSTSFVTWNKNTGVLSSTSSGYFGTKKYNYVAW